LSCIFKQNFRSCRRLVKAMFLEKVITRRTKERKKEKKRKKERKIDNLLVKPKLSIKCKVPKDNDCLSEKCSYCWSKISKINFCRFPLLHSKTNFLSIFQKHVKHSFLMSLYVTPNSFTFQLRFTFWRNAFCFSILGDRLWNGNIDHRSDEEENINLDFQNYSKATNCAIAMSVLESVFLDCWSLYYTFIGVLLQSTFSPL
jgi:hypothetical protein